MWSNARVLLTKQANNKQKHFLFTRLNTNFNECMNAITRVLGIVPTHKPSATWLCTSTLQLLHHLACLPLLLILRNVTPAVFLWNQCTFTMFLYVVVIYVPPWFYVMSLFSLQQGLREPAPADMTYIRGGKTQATGPHAASWAISAGPQTLLNPKYKHTAPKAARFQVYNMVLSTQVQRHNKTH